MREREKEAAGRAETRSTASRFPSPGCSRISRRTGSRTRTRGTGKGQPGGTGPAPGRAGAGPGPARAPLFRGSCRALPKSHAARSAANWGQLDGSQELPQLHCTAPTSLKGEATEEQTDYAPSQRLQLSPALLASSPACQVLRPSKLSLMLCASLVWVRRLRVCLLRPPRRGFAAVQGPVSLSFEGCRSSYWELTGCNWKVAGNEGQEDGQS